MVQLTDGRGQGFYAVTILLRHREAVMGKYFLAWLLGVPGIVLLLVWLFFN